jgi:hypothetical protein
MTGSAVVQYSQVLVSYSGYAGPTEGTLKVLPTDQNLLQVIPV